MPRAAAPPSSSGSGAGTAAPIAKDAPSTASPSVVSSYLRDYTVSMRTPGSGQPGTPASPPTAGSLYSTYRKEGTSSTFAAQHHHSSSHGLNSSGSTGLFTTGPSMPSSSNNRPPVPLPPSPPSPDSRGGHLSSQHEAAPSLKVIHDCSSKPVFLFVDSSDVISSSSS